MHCEPTLAHSMAVAMVSLWPCANAYRSESKIKQWNIPSAPGTQTACTIWATPASMRYCFRLISRFINYNWHPFALPPDISARVHQVNCCEPYQTWWQVKAVSSLREPGLHLCLSLIWTFATTFQQCTYHSAGHDFWDDDKTSPWHWHKECRRQVVFQQIAFHLTR